MLSLQLHLELMKLGGTVVNVIELFSLSFTIRQNKLDQQCNICFG